MPKPEGKTDEEKVLDALSEDTDTESDDSEASPTDGNSDDEGTPSDQQQAEDETAGDETAGESDDQKGAKDGKTDDKGKGDKGPLGDEAAVRKALGLKDTEPQTIEHWKTRHAESSREAKALKSTVTAHESSLSAQGLRAVPNEDGTGVDYVVADEEAYTDATKAAREKVVSDVVSGLSKEDKDLAVDDPAKFAKTVSERVAAAMLARPKPTKQAADVRLTDGEQQVVIESFAEQKGSDGEKAHPLFDQFDEHGYLGALLDDATTPPGFRDWMGQSEENYRFGLKAAYGMVFHAVQPLLQAQEREKQKLAGKKAAAETDVSLTSEGTGEGAPSSTGGEGGGDSDEAKEIAGAKSQW